MNEIINVLIQMKGVAVVFLIFAGTWLSSSLIASWFPEKPLCDCGSLIEELCQMLTTVLTCLTLGIMLALLLAPNITAQSFGYHLIPVSSPAFEVGLALFAVLGIVLYATVKELAKRKYLVRIANVESQLEERCQEKLAEAYPSTELKCVIAELELNCLIKLSDAHTLVCMGSNTAIDDILEEIEPSLLEIDRLCKRKESKDTLTQARRYQNMTIEQALGVPGLRLEQLPQSAACVRQRELVQAR